MFAAAAPPTETLDVVDASWISPEAPPGLLRIEDQVLYYQGRNMSTPGHHTFYDVNTAAEYCGLTRPIGVGASVTEQPFAEYMIGQTPRAKPLQTPNPANPANPYPPEPIRSQPVGTAVVLVVKREDVPAQSKWAAREGSDGVYEHLVQDGRWNVGGATRRADAELALFKDEILTASWVTTDLNASPGRAQVIALGGNGPLSATLTIQTVEIRFPVWGHAPFRACTGSSVKVSTLAEIAVTDSR
jgi:hypothetical protein